MDAIVPDSGAAFNEAWCERLSIAVLPELQILLMFLILLMYHPLASDQIVTTTLGKPGHSNSKLRCTLLSNVFVIKDFCK